MLLCALDGWLTETTATQAVPLISSPTMLVALLSPEVREASSTCMSDFFEKLQKMSALADTRNSA